MKILMSAASLASVAASVVLAAATPGSSALRPVKAVFEPEPMVQPLVSTPDSRGMHASRIKLESGEELTRLDTGDGEETIVPLTGEARVALADRVVELSPGQVLYLPPHTAHAIRNTGAQPLVYVFTAAPAR